MVLRQISNQTATYILYQGVMLNTTAALPSPPPPFEPSTAAILVNSLWFSSLILSLITASFGILVKQWLREFMACKVTTSPQGRLRLRHFRSPGIATWKVFEIAAVLPLLIQLALALFFIGLCAFTADAHPTVGRTTLPLVIAWALFFCIVLICPMFSARCPYKTPLIIELFAKFRTQFYSQLSQLGRHISDYATNRTLLQEVSDSVYSWALRHTSYCASGDRPHDESDAVTYDGKDLHVLAAADELQLNDDLLGGGMREAIMQSQASPQDTIDFVLKVLRNRLQQSTVNDTYNPRVLDLYPLTRLGWIAIIDLVVYGCSSEMQKTFQDSSDTFIP